MIKQLNLGINAEIIKKPSAGFQDFNKLGILLEIQRVKEKELEHKNKTKKILESFK